MWSDLISSARMSASGLCLTSVEQEAAWVLSGQPFAAVLTRFNLIKIEGEDAESFLQGQVTCDMTQVSAGKPQLGAHCNVKGRAQATFIAAFVEGSYYLILPTDQIEPTLAVLNKFALFSKATLSASSDYLIMGLGGDISESDYTTVENLSTLLPLSNGILIGLTPTAKASPLLSALDATSLNLLGDNAWQLHLIKSGIVFIEQSQSEQWIPQEINYELIEGISFNKGCYKGQEIIARIHYRGKTKIRAVELEINGCEVVNVGDKIVSDSGAGTVVSAAQSEELCFRVLCTMKVEQLESQILTLEENPDCQIRSVPLPYAIT